MKSVAVMLDGGYVQKRLYALLGKKYAGSADVLEFAKSCLNSSKEELLRIYYYDCPPCTSVVTNPMSGKQTDLGASTVAKRISRMHEELASSDHVAFRRGEIRFRGWRLKRQAYNDLIKGDRSCAGADFEYDLKQKGVDMRIGLDIAWLASKRIVDTIILAAGDTDFVPAMKFARREGVSVVLVPMRNKSLAAALRHHADEVRESSFPPPAKR